MSQNIQTLGSTFGIDTCEPLRCPCWFLTRAQTLFRSHRRALVCILHKRSKSPKIVHCHHRSRRPKAHSPTVHSQVTKGVIGFPVNAVLLGRVVAISVFAKVGKLTVQLRGGYAVRCVGFLFGGERPKAVDGPLPNYL